MDGWRIVYRLAWFLLLIVLPVGVASLFAPRCNKLRLLQDRKAQLAEEKRLLEEHTRDLQMHQERFLADPLFVERVAREAGMAKSNEVVFRLAPGGAGAVEPVTNRPADEGTAYDVPKGRRSKKSGDRKR